jgi:acyl-CoA synthetase (AMP-forming)/AMP-acid ligase II
MIKLFQNIKKFKKRIALVNEKNYKFTYEEIYNESKIFGSIIKNNSISVIIAKNNIECLIGYISLIILNRTTILIDENFSKNFLNKIIKKYKVNYIYAPEQTKNNFKNFNTIYKKNNYFIFETNNKINNKINKMNLLLLTTSGSTQSPKLVRLSNSNLSENTNNIVKYLSIKKEHTTITTMPFAYSYGLSILNSHLQVGAKIVVNNYSVFNEQFWKLVKLNKVISFGGVPKFYENLKRLNFNNLNLYNLKYLTQAGGKMDEDVLKFFGKICKQKKIKFYIMYGQTEASPRMSYLNWKDFFSKLGSIGKPLDSCKFRIINNKNKIINKNYYSGQLVFYGKNVSLGYAKNFDDLLKGNINNGKLFTGDIAFKDKDDFYFITGRKNRISKIFGLRLDLDDIEKFLKKNNIISKCEIDNKILKILVINKYSSRHIKSIVSKFLNINVNYILVTRVKKYPRQNIFK